MADLRKHDTDKILDNEAGPEDFRIERVPARLAVSGPGILKSWQGDAFDAGERFTGTDTIVAPGWYEITLDAPGYVTIQEPI